MNSEPSHLRRVKIEHNKFKQENCPHWVFPWGYADEEFAELFYDTVIDEPLPGVARIGQ